MKKVILCPNLMRDEASQLTYRVSEIIEKNGGRAVICPFFADEKDIPAHDRLVFSDISDELRDAYMIITLGGDGTILKAARAAASFNVPILGVNLGYMGFMTELDYDEIEYIDKAFSGEYTIKKRMMLDVELIRNDKVVFTDFALNDVVVRGLSRVIDISLFGDGELISRFSGDGTVVATPTGSTAYSMSAGGPIVEPSAENIIITPICAHALATKSFVLAPDRDVYIELGGKKTNPAYLSVDGGDTIELYTGDKVHIRRSAKQTDLVSIANRSFYKIVSEKLGERT